MRQGIPFGPEVSDEECRSGKTAKGVHRGLAFVCYQSVINNGFQFIQESMKCPFFRKYMLSNRLYILEWVNNIKFIVGKTDANGDTILPGFDPISTYSTSYLRLIGTHNSDRCSRHQQWQCCWSGDPRVESYSTTHEPEPPCRVGRAQGWRVLLLSSDLCADGQVGGINGLCRNNHIIFVVHEVVPVVSCISVAVYTSSVLVV